MDVKVQHQLPHDQNGQNAAQVKEQYKALREESDVVRVAFPFGGDGWMTTKYELTRQFYNDVRFGKEPMLTLEDYPRIRQTEMGATPTFLSYDGEKHQSKRRVIMKYLTVKRVQAMRPEIEQIVEDSLDEFERSGSPAEMGVSFGRNVPLKVLCALFGTTTIDDQEFLDACDVLSPSGAMTIAEAVAANQVIVNYFKKIVKDKKENPDDRLISNLMGDAETGSWTNEEFMGVGKTLLAAGHEATGNMLSGILEWLSHDPELYARLRAEPERIPRAMEEFYRCTTGGIGVPQGRIAVVDVEFGGVQIKAGEAVAGNIVASHFDPEAYPNPNVLDIDRESPKPHMAFGYGPHACVGAQLARTEISIAVSAVLSRYKTFVNENPSEDWPQQRGLRGSRTLNIRWEKA